MSQETSIPTSLDLCIEAKRQSVLACQQDQAEDEALWEKNHDESGWE